MKSSSPRHLGVGFAAAFLALGPVIRACNLESCIVDVLKIPTVDAGDATKGYLQAAAEDNPVLLVTTSKDITAEVLQTIDDCKGCSVSYYPDCSTTPGKVESAHTRSCGGAEQVVQATGQRRCASYATQVQALVGGDIFFGKQNQFVFHCNNTHAFDGINECFYDCTTCDQCGGQKAAGDLGPGLTCPAPVPGADPTTAQNGLTVPANFYVDIGPPDPADIDPDDDDQVDAASSTEASKHRRQNSRDVRLSTLLEDLTLEERSTTSGSELFERVAESDLVPVPRATWWKYTNDVAGYRFEGAKSTTAWGIVYNNAFSTISDLSLGPVTKDRFTKKRYRNGILVDSWQSDHILEGQILSQFFSSNQARYNDLLRELVIGWTGPQAPENSKTSSTFSNFGNCNIKNVVTILNGPGNIQALADGLNGYKGGLLMGKNQKLNPNKALDIAGLTSYWVTVQAMHDATAQAIGTTFDNIPNAGGQFGTEFVNFAKGKWADVQTLLQQQYYEVRDNRPLLLPQATSGPFPQIMARPGPPPAPTTPPASSSTAAAPTLAPKLIKW